MGIIRMMGEVQFPRPISLYEAKVNQIYEVLKADGFDVAAPERHHVWTCYVQSFWRIYSRGHGLSLHQYTNPLE
jgi:hypothetical protein